LTKNNEATNAQPICCDCISEEYLSSEMVRQNRILTCSECGVLNPAIPLEELAELTLKVLTQNYYPTSSEPEGLAYYLAKEDRWEQPGEQLVNQLEELLSCSYELAERICKDLSARYGPVGNEAFDNDLSYEPGALWEISKFQDDGYFRLWHRFKSEVFSRSRYFSEEANNILANIFNGVENLLTADGAPVVQILEPNACFYRARVALNETQLLSILESQPDSIGPPAPQYANPGRMNAVGIGVFYGAFSKDVCLAEVRAPVGSSVVMGKFSPTRRINVLDLTKLQSATHSGSLFNSVDVDDWKRIQFVKFLVAEISFPVMPGDEIEKYLPTQIISEYLQSKLKLDGVIFNSSQVSSNNSADIRNIVIFNKSCLVDDYNLPPNTKVEANVYWGDPDDPDDTINIWERQTIEDRRLINEPIRDIYPHDFEPYKEETDLPDRIPTLHLHIEETEVLIVEAISYATTERSVTRHRIKDNPTKPEEF
jgi:hypothetical protein